MQVFRFWNRNTGAHFYTASEAEKQYVLATWPTTFLFEGVAYEVDTAAAGAAVPLHRFYNRRTGSHFYTASGPEKDYVLGRADWPFSHEGIAYGVIPSSADTGTPVYRFYNRRTSSHFYTASAAEKDYVLGRTDWPFSYEGAAFRVSSVPPPDPTAPVVCIDPGHQARANLAPEPIGPGSATTKPKVAGGTTGVVTHVPEYRFALLVSLRVKARLEARGVRVVMTRVSDDVDISNAQRAQLANSVGARLLLRIHADGSTNHSVHGISTLYPTGNWWVAPIEAPSLRAAQTIHAGVVGATGAADRGLSGRGDMTGFNWSTVPAVIVESGFMTNSAEDRALNSEAYQERLAAGIAAGVLAYLGR
jgi:N-acetylmuramoyl-L-alanine amidase